MSQARWEQPLGWVVIEITNRCNLRCAHCASVSGQPREGELDGDQWCRVIDQLAELGCQEVTLIGGETFLHPDWLQVARHVKASGIGLAIVTNGLVSQKVLEHLPSLELNALGVSLDAATPETYQAVRGVDGHARIWRLLERVEKEEIAPLVAITSLSRVNAHEFDLLAAQLKEKGISWQIQFVHSIGERFDERLALSPEEYGVLCKKIGDLLLECEDAPWLTPMDDFGYFPLDPRQAHLHAAWEGCHAGLSVAGIRANGDLLPCLSLGDPFVDGNLKDRSLVELWRDPSTFQAFREKTRRLEGVCASCPKAEVCRAGCPAMAYTATESIYENRYCLRHLECAEIVGDLFD